MARRTETGKTLYQNIRFFCKVNSVRISEVEAAVGVSQGYFSRCCDNVPARTIYLLAEMFDVSMEELLVKDIAKDARLLEVENEIAALMAEREELTGNLRVTL